MFDQVKQAVTVIISVIAFLISIASFTVSYYDHATKEEAVRTAELALAHADNAAVASMLMDIYGASSELRSRVRPVLESLSLAKQLHRKIEDLSDSERCTLGDAIAFYSYVHAITESINFPVSIEESFSRDMRSLFECDQALQILRNRRPYYTEAFYDHVMKFKTGT